MLFVILCLSFSFIFYIAYSKSEAKHIIFNKLFIFSFCVSILISAFLFFQDTYISNNFLEVNTLVTFDEEGYPTTHSVKLYQNISTEKIYTLKNYLGFYILDEITLGEGVKPLVTDAEHPITHFNGITLYS